MKIEEMLKKITPLPHELRHGNKFTENEVASIRGITIFGKYKSARAIDDAAYYLHAANMLPGLVEAGQRLREQPKSVMAYQDFLQALIRAEKVLTDAQ